RTPQFLELDRVLGPRIESRPRLRLFSGRCPRPNNEVDFESWRSSVELLLKDAKQPDSSKSRRLLESLSSPAVDLVKHLPADSPPVTYLQILDSAFGTVEDGDDLFAKYLNTMQNHGEEPSSYLQRLQVMLNTTFIRGGISAGELDKQLLKQFIRGCWDNDLIAELQLEQKKQTPPTFADLLLMLRTAEKRRTSKMSRMKQHLNTTKPKVYSHYQGAQSQSPERPRPKAVDSEIQNLKKQIADLQSHLSSDQRPDIHSSNRPKPWYCFKCGEDGHIKPQCENEPNSHLISNSILVILQSPVSGKKEYVQS
uniref:CCHC-type domain-containing protein n=1 Tax=Neogobius melanostomus TaxID=47308 RepID=A0A8C6TK85_9GOBI